MLRNFTTFLFAMALGLLIITTSLFFFDFEDTVIATLAFIIGKMLMRDLETNKIQKNE